jgi:hypothetical protein
MALLGIGLLVGGCRQPASQPPSPPVQTAPARGDARVAGTGYRFVFPPAPAAKAWEITANFQGDADSGTVTLSKVSGTLYRTNAPVLQVTAGAGTAVVEGKTARLSLSDHVRARATQKGYTLDADTFRWSTADGLIHAERVCLRGEGLTHRADRGTFTTDLTQATFDGHVTTTSDGYRGRK